MAIIKKFCKNWGEEIQIQVYKRVRAYIEAHHLEEKSVANLAGIPYAEMAAMLSGRRKMYADDLRAICIALEVSADLFLEAGDLACVSPGKVPTEIAEAPRKNINRNK